MALPTTYFRVKIDIDHIHIQLYDRYSNFLKVHSKLAKAEKNLPTFPPKNNLSDMTKDDNIRERTQKLTQYFYHLFIHPTAVANPILHESFDLSPFQIDALKAYSKVLAARKEQVDAHDKEEKAMAAEYENNLMLSARRFSQSFHLHPYQFLCIDNVYGAIHVPMVFKLPHATTLKIDGWNLHARVKDTSGNVWFQEESPYFGPNQEQSHLLTNVRSDPLLYLERATAKGNVPKFRLYRVAMFSGQPSTGPFSPETHHLMKLCSIKMFVAPHLSVPGFLVKTAGPKGHRSTSSVVIEGSWADRNLHFFDQHGKPLGRQLRDGILSDNYKLDVAPNNDILFFVGLAMAAGYLNGPVKKFFKI